VTKNNQWFYLGEQPVARKKTGPAKISFLMASFVFVAKPESLPLEWSIERCMTVAGFSTSGLGKSA
jgi:hypothetical protein